MLHIGWKEVHKIKGHINEYFTCLRRKTVPRMPFKPISRRRKHLIFFAKRQENVNNQDMASVILMHQVPFHRIGFPVDVMLAGIMKMKLP